MSWAKNSEALRSVVYSGLVLSLAAAGLWYGASQNNTSAKIAANAVPAATFAGTGVGPIPDGGSGCAPTPGAPLNISFAVSGISTAPSNVSVDFTSGTPAHTWIGDVVAVLIAPNGTSHSIFGRTGATTATAAGSGNNLTPGAVYTYNNAASTNWWTHVTANVTIPGGSFRTSNSGGAGATNPMPATDMNAAFAGIGTSNGTWTLRFTDGCSADTGSVSAANLVLEGAAAPGPAPHDVTGDGKSDFYIVRADGAPLGDFMGVNDRTGKDKVGNMERRAENAIPQVGIGWWVANSNQTSIGRFDHGVDTDFFLSGDYDFDGRKDLTVWTPGVAGVAGFKILQSSNNTVATRLYGQTGDDPTIGGDWNGDGRDDLAVYRDGTGASPQSFFFWSDQATPTSVNYIVWGTDGDVPYALDYDGDGKSDAAIQRNGGGGAGHHWIRQSSNGATVFVSYGLSSDFVVPGDYDGDGRDDLCISRNANFGTGTFKYFWVLESDGGGTPQSPFQWGIPGDFITQGDYDGDGKTDLAVWRSNADPALNFFFVKRSSDGALQQFEWGASGDYPVNNWNVH